MTELTPREIVSELDRHIIGQADAKRAVAIALRNRWRRKNATESIRDEITPKNILMIGPTGVGKTEISRRLAKLAKAPFIKIEATKFTEVGYVGRDVDQIIRDLVEASIGLVRAQRQETVKAKAHAGAEERVLDALVGASASPSTRESFREKLRSDQLDDKEIEIQVEEQIAPPFELPGGQGVGMINLGDMLKGALGSRQTSKRMTVRDAYDVLMEEESDKLIDQDALNRDAVRLAEQEGIVFLDEIDKIAAREDRRGGDVSREGVQRDLLPLIEGTTVATNHGPVKTDHILFIASGAFHVAKPSDLLPELQGRLPIRVELSALTKEDFARILTEPQASLVAQYRALLETEGVELAITEDGVEALAHIAADVNARVENIGARRLHTILERVLDEVSFDAGDRVRGAVKVDAAYVRERLDDVAADADLTKYVL